MLDEWDSMLEMEQLIAEQMQQQQQQQENNTTTTGHRDGAAAAAPNSEHPPVIEQPQRRVAAERAGEKKNGGGGGETQQQAPAQQRQVLVTDNFNRDCDPAEQVQQQQPETRADETTTTSTVVLDGKGNPENTMLHDDDGPPAAAAGGGGNEDAAPRQHQQQPADRSNNNNSTNNLVGGEEEDEEEQQQESSGLFGPHDVVLLENDNNNNNNSSSKNNKRRKNKATRDFETALVRRVRDGRAQHRKNQDGSLMVAIRKFVQGWASRSDHDRNLWYVRTRDDGGGRMASIVTFDPENNPLDQSFLPFLERYVERAIRQRPRLPDNVEAAPSVRAPDATKNSTVAQQQQQQLPPAQHHSPIVHPTQVSNSNNTTTTTTATFEKAAAATAAPPARKSPPVPPPDNQHHGVIIAAPAVPQHQQNHHASATKHTTYRIERYDCVLGTPVAACPGNAYFQQLLAQYQEKQLGRRPANVQEALRMAGAACTVIAQQGGRILKQTSDDSGRNCYEIQDCPSIMLWFRTQCEKAFAKRDKNSKRATAAAPPAVVDLTEGDYDDNESSPWEPIPVSTATAAPATATPAMSPPPGFPQELCQCTPRDVLLGSNNFAYWPGNRYCMERMHYYVCRAAKGYNDAEWRRSIVDRIVQAVLANGGRFLGPHNSYYHWGAALHNMRLYDQHWVLLNSQTVSWALYKMLDEYQARKAAAELSNRGQQNRPAFVPAFAQQQQQPANQHWQSGKRPNDGGGGGAKPPPHKKANRAEPTAAALAFQGTIYGNKHRVIWAGPPDDKIEGVDWTGWQKEKEERDVGNHLDSYWYTPIHHFKLRSRPEVQQFCAALKACGGDERQAKRMLKESQKKKTAKSREPAPSDNKNFVEQCAMNIGVATGASMNNQGSSPRIPFATSCSILPTV